MMARSFDSPYRDTALNDAQRERAMTRDEEVYHATRVRLLVEELNSAVRDAAQAGIFTEYSAEVGETLFNVYGQPSTPFARLSVRLSRTL